MRQRRQTLNLARNPFVNARPVRRLSRLLWCLAVALLLFNGYLYWRYLSVSVESRAELAQLRTETDAAQSTIRRLRSDLQAFDLADQNEQVEFLNRVIAERTFPWGELFEQLTEVLPRQVRLTSLSPRSQSERTGRSRRARRRQADERVELVVIGTTSDDEALLEFVQALYEHPAFEEPRLNREQRDSGTLTRFDLVAKYRSPRLAAPAEAAAEVVITEASPAEGAPAAALAQREGQAGTPAAGQADAVDSPAARPGGFGVARPGAEQESTDSESPAATAAGGASPATRSARPGQTGRASVPSQQRAGGQRGQAREGTQSQRPAPSVPNASASPRLRPNGGQR